MWKEAIVAYVKVLSQHCPEVTEGNHENSQPLGQESNSKCPDHEAGMLNARPQHFV